MTLEAFLRDLALAGMRIYLEDGRLRYRAPKAVISDAVLARLKENRDAIVSLLRSSPETVEVCPLSYGQRALWFLWKLSPESTAYNQSEHIVLRRRADHEVWRAACQAVIERHAILRSVFPVRDGEPYQQALRPKPVAFEVIDAEGWSEEQLRAAMERVHKEPFDLARGPVVRFRWFERAAEDHTLLVSMHHVVCDGWSFAVLFRDLVRAAEMAARGELASLEPLKHTYHDYVRWQHELLGSPAGERLWAFWREQLEGPLPSLQLPADHPRPRTLTHGGDTLSFALPNAVAERLTAFARDEGATPFVAYLSAFVALLHRLSGQERIILGTFTAGRSAPEFAGLVGYFVEPLVLQAQIGPDETFRSLLATTRRTVLAAMEHRDLPFAYLVERLQPSRDPSRSPLFDVTFNYLSTRSAARARGEAPDPSAAPSEATPDPLDLRGVDSKFDLTLAIIEGETSTRGTLTYNTALFERASVARMAEQLAALLEQASTEPARPLGALRLTAEREDGPRPALSGRSWAPSSEPPLLHRRIAEQAARVPDAIAVQARGEVLRYAELQERADALARTLRSRGVGPDVPVALYMARTIHVVVALLGVLRAGAAYLPLDTSHPAGLLRRMLEKSGAKLVLTDEAFASASAELALPVLRADLLPGGPADMPLPDEVEAEHLAYVIFTSGSTGVPKGVGVPHRALANYVASIVSDLAMEEGRRFAMVSTFAADLGHTVLFPALATGGALHLVPDDALLDPAAFAAYVRDHAIDYLKIVPSHLAALADGRRSVLPARAVFLGGEPTSLAWLERLQAAAPGCRFFNHYGPTETTVGVLTGLHDPLQPAHSGGFLPLRRAVAETDIYLLDDQRNEVPPGIVGELYVGGRQVARGYLNDPDLTAASFVPHPSPGSPAAARSPVLYRTGDLARLASDGALQILGRKDRQLKVRGYRVELGQVEVALARHPAVHRCVVLPDRDDGLATHLLAWVVTSAKADPSALDEMLERHMEALVPSYMVPGRFVPVDHIPLTTNGKVDARALRRLLATTSSSADDGKSAAPMTPFDAELCRIWSEVLGVPVSLHDDFFRLGGHSLLAVRLAMRIEEQLGVPLALAALFAHPTVAKLSRFLRQEHKETTTELLAPIRTGGANAPVLCLPGAGGNVFYFQDLARLLDGDRSVWGLQAIGFDPSTAIPSTIEEIAARYVDELTAEPGIRGPLVLLGHSFGGLVAFEMARRLEAAGRPLGLLGVLDNPAPAVEPLEPRAGWGDAEWLVHIATRIGKLYNINLGVRSEDFRNMTAEGRVRHMIEQLIAARLLPAGTTLGQFGRFIEIYRANAMAASAYRAEGARLAADIHLFVSRDDDPELRRHRIEDPSLGWQALTSGRVHIVEVPGTHITMMTMPNVAHLARALSERLRTLV